MFFYKCIPLSYIFEKALVTVPVWDSPVFLFTGDELSKKKRKGGTGLSCCMVFIATHRDAKGRRMDASLS